MNFVQLYETTDERKHIVIVKISRSLQNLKTNFSLI
jgi:hypothetical protein